MQKQIYLDNAATTRVNPKVVDAMLPYFSEFYGNSNSLHGYGRRALEAVDKARKTIADFISAETGEIYFTSGGTESNNWALLGVSEVSAHKGKHIIVSAIEHHSIMDTALELKRKGFEIDFLKVDKQGRVNFEELKKLVRNDTILVSIMTANNEVGTIQDIKKIGEFLKDKKAIFHTDAVQALSSVRINVKEMNIDLLSCSSHKVHGPKGVGALFIRNGVAVKRMMIGGEQEKSRRGGTVNVPGIVGFGKAIEILNGEFDKQFVAINDTANYFLEKINKNISEVVVNSPQNDRIPGVLNISFRYIEGESILLLLDFDGIAVSTGSACASGSLQKSHVLKAMGQTAELINGAVRFSFDDSISHDDIDFVVEKLKAAVDRLRIMSPLGSKKK